jgi:MerR family transcriptional regulator, light-induced transcriptional regulator
MSEISQKLADEISAKSDSMVQLVIKEQYRRHPELEKRYGPAGKQRCREDIEYHFCTLSEAVASEEEAIWLNYVTWGKIVLANRKIRTDDLIDTFTLMQDVLSENVSKRASAIASEFLQRTIDLYDSFPNSVPSYIDDRAPLSKLANAYLQALLSVDRNEARKLIHTAVNTGTRVEDIFRYVFEPVQYEVGRLWQMNHISVAQEHYCTATTEMIMGELHRDREEIDGGPHFFLGTCVAGGQHSVGIRMVSELLEAAGWKVYFTGANTPATNIVELISRFTVNVLGISAATPMDLAQVRRLIKAVRAASKAETKIMVGGRVFNDFPDLWKKVGADGWEKDAVSAVTMAFKMVQTKRPTPPGRKGKAA